MSDDDIICTCMSVSVMDIKKAIEAGAESFLEIQETTGIGTVCGACDDDAQVCVTRLLREHKEQVQ